MYLPNYEKAIIDPSKLRDYLLSLNHSEGASKAIIFYGLGYSELQWEVLENDIRNQLLSNEAVKSEISEHGQKYSVKGVLTGPNGNSRTMVSVWIIRNGEEYPRLVTIYPHRGRL